MAFRHWTVLIAAACSSLPLAAQPAPGQPPATGGIGSVDRKTQTEDVHFRNEYNDRMTVPVLLGGAGPYRFLVDTGADRTAIARQLATRLNLAAGSEVALHSVVGVSNVSTASIPSLQVTRKPVKVSDAPLLDSANMGADGIIGTDSLAAQRVVFDFASQTMSVVPSSTPDFRDEPGTIVVEGRRKNGRLIVTEASADDHRLTVVVDTGSQVSIGNEALRKALSGKSLVDGAQTVELQSVTGEKITGSYMFIRDLEVGGIGLKNLAVVFAPAHTFKQLKLDSKPALLLGMNAIRAFKKVSIDFANKRLRVVVPESSEREVQVASIGG